MPTLCWDIYDFEQEVVRDALAMYMADIETKVAEGNEELADKYDTAEHILRFLDVEPDTPVTLIEGVS